MKDITYRCDLCKDVIERGVAILWTVRVPRSVELSRDMAVARPLNDRECECHVCNSCLGDLHGIFTRGTHS